jgi:hypothetical protein
MISNIFDDDSKLSLDEINDKTKNIGLNWYTEIINNETDNLETWFENNFNCICNIVFCIVALCFTVSNFKK